MLVPSAKSSVSSVTVPPNATALPLTVIDELASFALAMLPANCEFATDMFVTLLDQSAPAVALAAIPSNLVFRVLVNTLLVEPSAILSALIAAFAAMFALLNVVPTAMYALLKLGMSLACNTAKRLAGDIFFVPTVLS